MHLHDNIHRLYVVNAVDAAWLAAELLYILRQEVTDMLRSWQMKLSQGKSAGMSQLQAAHRSFVRPMCGLRIMCLCGNSHSFQASQLTIEVC